MRRTLFAIFVMLLAAAAAAALAYGTSAASGTSAAGLRRLMLARRLQWPLVGVALTCCLLLLGGVIGSKLRTWCLLGLVPVALLFAHRFGGDPIRQLAVIEDPPMLAPSDPAAPADGDPVLGVVFNGASFAFSYTALGAAPVVLQESHAQRFLLMWSPYANRATASAVSRDIKPRDLEIVSMPAGALLVYNGRLGQFINGVTGTGTDGRRPGGFFSPVDVQKRTWGEWKSLHPSTRVMAAPAGAVAIHTPQLAGDGSGSAAAVLAGPSLMAASGPAPSPLSTTGTSAGIITAAGDGPSPQAAGAGMAATATTPVVFINAGRPIACDVQALAGGPAYVDAPAEGALPEVHLLVFRDGPSGGGGGGSLRVFDRRVMDPDTREAMFPTFRRNGDPKKLAQHVAFIDNDSGSAWTVGLKAVEGAWKNQQLRLVREVDENVPWGIMKTWYPQLAFVTPKAMEEIPHSTAGVPAHGGKVVRRSRRR